MNSNELFDTFVARLSANSGFETDRSYVGMSRAGDCPLRVYLDVVNGMKPRLTDHVGAWLGYTLERSVKDILNGTVKPGRELTAFGGACRGHTDGELSAKELFELKTVTADKIEGIIDDGKVPRRHFMQAQSYMHFGGYEFAAILYVPRDYGTPYISTLRYLPDVGRDCEQKLQRIVLAVRDKRPPQCECGRCRGAMPAARRPT